MKFTVALLASIIAIATIRAEDTSPTAGSSILLCPDVCLDDLDPVTDEIGNTYINECRMQMEKCRGDKKFDLEDILEDYKKIHGKPFGAPRESNSGDDSTSSSSASDKLHCPKVCPGIALPVCGSDGIKYANRCRFDRARCKNPEPKVVEEDGACSSPLETSMPVPDSPEEPMAE